MFHKEGFTIIIVSFILSAAAIFALDYFVKTPWLKIIFQIVCLVLLILVLQFFRNPKRLPLHETQNIVAPVDGKVVIIEEVDEKEYFKDKRLQVSIFMSPLNVHVTRYPTSGEVVFSQYHPGKYLVAWHPKSSELNERTTIVVRNEKYGDILYRQIAGAVARRIVNYAQVGDQALQGEDAGFIKFGSRVDLFLPLGTEIQVTLDQKIKGGIDFITKNE